MVTLQEVERQLDAIGANYRFWGRAEIVELQHILIPGEQIKASLNGRYQGGFATFVATDQRLLLVDKKLFYLTVEDMRYDMIAEVDFGAQLMSGTIRVCTPTKNLSFTTFKPKQLRQVATYIQQRVMEIRHHSESLLSAQQLPGAPVAPAPIEPATQLVATTPTAEEPALAAQTAEQPEPVPEPMAVAPAPEPVAEPVPTPSLSQTYAAMLGNQAVSQASSASTEESLPAPQRRNPYMNPPLMMRHRVGRFGPIGTWPSNPTTEP